MVCSVRKRWGHFVDPRGHTGPRHRQQSSASVTVSTEFSYDILQREPIFAINVKRTLSHAEPSYSVIVRLIYYLRDFVPRSNDYQANEISTDFISGCATEKNEPS